MQYQCILGIYFMKESRLTLDFDQKSLIIPDNQIKQLPKIEKPVDIDLRHKTVTGKQRELKAVLNNFKVLFSDPAGVNACSISCDRYWRQKGPVVSRPYRPTTGEPLAHANEFRGLLDLTASDRWHQTTTTTTNASGVGIDAVLQQNQKHIAFASRTLNKAERNYTVTERECLAVIWALNKFKTYFRPLPVKVITDHAALTNGKNLSSRMIRWALKLSEFNIEWEHRPGVQNVVAYILSRNPVDSIEGSQISWAALRALAINSH
ncbi:retrovirus-related Pol polyprotein from transposon opus [Trichonephila clavipes]|nr:retrovirus-related Pol polyprotein from transposon opus [Trichonephila clavipes]